MQTYNLLSSNQAKYRITIHFAHHSKRVAKKHCNAGKNTLIFFLELPFNKSCNMENLNLED